MPLREVREEEERRGREGKEKRFAGNGRGRSN